MSKPDEDDRNVQTSVRMSPELLADLRVAAKRERRTQSAIMETALEEYLERQEGTGLPDELVRAVKEYLARHQQPES